MDEEFGSFVVTDPDLVDPGIDISGLRTQTDINRALLGNVAPGIQYEGIGFNPTALSDLSKFFQFGLPAIDTSAAAVPPATGGGGGGSGDGGQGTIPDVDLGGNTPEDQRLIDEGIGLQIAPGDPVVAPGEMPITQAEMDEFNYPELSEEMSEVSIPTPPPFEMPRGGGADIDTFDTTPRDSSINIEGTETITAPSFEGDVTYTIPISETTPDFKPIEDLPIAQEPLDVPTQDVGLAYTGEFDPDDEGTVFDTTSITPQDTEQSITQKVADFFGIDASKVNKAAVTGALNLMAGKALDTVIPVATVANLIKDSFIKSPEQEAAEEQARQDNIDEAAAITQRLEDEVTEQDIIDDRGRGEIPTRTEPEPTPTFEPPRGGGADRDPAPSAPSQPDYSNVTTASAPPGRGGGSGGPPSQGGGSPGAGSGCVIATHAVNSGAFSKDTKREAVRWCVKNLHRTWWGEAIRRGYRYYGQKAIEEGKAKNHYQEFKDYVAFGTGRRRTLKTGWTFVYRSIQFFIRGLING